MCDCWSKPQCMKESARTRPVYNLTNSNFFLFFFGWFLLFCNVLFWFFRSSHLMHEHYRQWEQVVRHTDSRARLHGFKSRPWHLLEIITFVKLINLFKSPFPPLSMRRIMGLLQNTWADGQSALKGQSFPSA